MLTGAVVVAGTASVRAQEAASYTPGSAFAEAQPFGITIVYNSANIGVGVGTARAQYSSSSAKAVGAPFNFGLAGLITSLQFCGVSPVPPGSLPEPLEASTDAAGGQPVERSAGSQQGVAFGAARLRAAPNASAEADVTALGFDLPTIAAFSGGRSHARVVSDPAGRARSAAADTSGDLVLLDGLVRLEGMRFRVAQTSVGADHRASERGAESDVALGALTLAGVPVPLPDDPDQGVAALNTLLGPLGLRFRAPQVVAEGSNGLRMTPLTVSIGGDSLYSDLVRQLGSDPALVGLQRALQTGLFDSTTCAQLGGVMQAFPQLNSLYNVIGVLAPVFLAVVVSAAGGDGSIDVEVGGARTKIDDTLYEGSFTRREPAAVSPAPAHRPAVAAPATDGVAAPPDVETIGPVARASTRCATTSPAGRPGCWRGLAPLGALAALGVTAALLAVDEVRRRRTTSMSEAR